MGIERRSTSLEDRRFPGLAQLLEVERGRLDGGLRLGDGFDRGRRSRRGGLRRRRLG